MVSFSIEVESKKGHFITVISKEKWYKWVLLSGQYKESAAILRISKEKN